MEPDNAIAKITKGKDKKNDTMLIMAPFSNWDRFLTPAPSAIAILGELLTISTKTEFDLRERMPEGGFKYLKYPDSFRTCLLQITNSGWNAFNEAHTCMDQIRLTSSCVDIHVKEAVRILMAGTPIEIQKLLPLALKNVEQIANDSLDLAQKIENQFRFVMNLTEELLEASTATKSLYDKKAKETKTKIDVASIEEKCAKADLNDREKRYKNMEKQIEKAQDEYEKAVKDIPGSLHLLGVAFAESMIESVKAIISLPADTVKGLGSGSYNIAKGMIDAAIDTRHTEPKVSKKSLNKQLAEFNVLRSASQIDTLISQIETFIGGPGKEPDTQSIREGISAIKEFLTVTHANVVLETESGALGTHVSEVCTKGIEICEKVRVMSESLLKASDSKVNDLQLEVAALRKESMALVANANKTLGRNPLDEKSPCLRSETMKNQMANFMKTTTETVRFKTELAKKNLTETRVRTDAAEKQLDQANKRLCEALKAMKTLNIETIEFEEIRKTLQQGISALAEVRAQWGQLVVFFEEIANVIKCCMNTSLKKFVETAGVAGELRDKDEIMSKAFRAIMYDQTLHASRISYVVSTMAGAYVDISRDHLIGQVTNLSKLIALDPEKDKHKIDRERMQLHNECEQAQEAIRYKIRKQHEHYESAIDERIKQIEEEVEAIMPPPENLVSIQEAVTRGYTDEYLDDLVG